MARRSSRVAYKGRSATRPTRGTPHSTLSVMELVNGTAAALQIRTDKCGVTLINVHGPQAGCSLWAGRAAFWADIKMYATARSLGGRHRIVITGDANVYMDPPPTRPRSTSARTGRPAASRRPQQAVRRT